MSILPGLAQFRGYRREWLRGDVLAGVTVAAYLVPQVMAYATLAGLPAVVGLWAALVPLALYALLGSSRQLSVGPESTTALMTATALAPLAIGDPQRYAAVKWFVLNAEANVEVDLTALDVLDQLRAELESRGIDFAMARVKQDLRVMLEAAGLVDKIGEDRIFMTLPTAVEAYRNRRTA